MRTIRSAMSGVSQRHVLLALVLGVCAGLIGLIAVKSSRVTGAVEQPDPPADRYTAVPDVSSTRSPADNDRTRQPGDASATSVPEVSARAADVPEDLAGIATETDPVRVRWRVLRFGLQEYRKLETKSPRGSREGTLLCDSVSAILEARGRGAEFEPNRSGTTSSYYMMSNGRGYSWSPGEFPEYDAWQSYMLGSGEEPDPRKPQVVGGIEPTFDSANFALIEARAEEAIALLESRYGFSSKPK